MSDFQVYSPADGKLLPLEQVPDPAFAEHMLGDGIAVEPSQGFTAAPFDGTVTSIHKALHAVVISRPGLEVLIHVGVETVNLQGKGFKALVKAGDQVKKGQHLTEFDPVFLAKNAPCNWVILIVTSPDGARLNKAPLGQVSAGVSPVFSLPDLQARMAREAFLCSGTRGSRRRIQAPGSSCLPRAGTSGTARETILLCSGSKGCEGGYGQKYFWNSDTGLSGFFPCR